MDLMKPPRPNSYLALAIISTILCCPATGIVSIIYATKVNSSYEDGKFDEANLNSKNAKIWGLVSVGISVVGWLLYMLIFGVALFGAFSNGDF